MKRNIAIKVHAVAGALALLIILTFFSSTVVAELRGDIAVIAAVKRYIAYGLALLIPAMAAVGLTGSRLSGRSQAHPILVKRRRMAVIAANGILILTPCALALHWLASSGSFGLPFYLIQGLELVAGPVNIALIALNIRDGLKLSGRLHKKYAT